MYQIIAALMLSSVFAQVDPAPDCDVNELAQRCFVSACGNSRSGSLPTTTQELEAALARANYRMPPENSTQLDQFVNSLVDLNRRSNSLVEARGYDGIAEDILSNLDQNFEPVYAFFRGDIPMIQNPDGTFQFIVSDMIQDRALGQRMGTFLKSYFELFFGLSQARTRVNQPGAAEFYRSLLSEVETFYSSTGSPRLNDLRARREALRPDSSATEIAGAVISLLNQDDVKALFRRRFIGVKNDLAAFLRTRAEENRDRVTKGTQPGPIRASIMRSCALASYMINSVAPNVSPERAFADARQAAVRGMSERFTSKLSAHSKSLLESTLTDNVFVPINFNQNIYPDWPRFTQGLQQFSQNMNPSMYLMQTAAFDESTRFACAIDSFLPEDRFQNGQINTSLFAIASGHPDILAHELGHWVSARMSASDMSETSRAKFTALRQCIGGFYGNEQHTEEDFADWFMNTTVPPTQMACTLDTVVPMLVNYMIGRNVPERDLYSPIAGESHSGSLFRELHGRLVRGETLSLPCRQLVNSHPEARPVKCEL